VLRAGEASIARLARDSLPINEMSEGATGFFGFGSNSMKSSSHRGRLNTCGRSTTCSSTRGMAVIG